MSETITYITIIVPVYSDRIIYYTYTCIYYTLYFKDIVYVFPEDSQTQGILLSHAIRIPKL